MKSEFSEFLSKEYVKWRGDAIGNERSITDYATFLGFQKATLTAWINGSRTPKSQKSINQLVSHFGDITYSLLGLREPSKLSSLPSGIRSGLEAAISELNAETIAKGIKPESPEALALAASIFKKHGFTINSTTTEP